MSIEMYTSENNPYTQWQKIDGKVCFCNGNFFERATYNCQLSSIYRLRLFCWFAAITALTIGIAAFMPSLRQWWKKAWQGYLSIVVDIVHTDAKSRLKLFKAIALKKGEGWAQHNIGYCHLVGIGAEKNLKEAVSWLKKAAENCVPHAQNNYGYCLLNGIGTRKDAAQALNYFRKALDNSHLPALLNLAECYETGNGVKPDEEAVAILREKAAHEGIVEKLSPLSTP